MVCAYYLEEDDEPTAPLAAKPSATYFVTDEDLKPDVFKDEITQRHQLVDLALQMTMSSMSSPEESGAWREVASKQGRPDGRYRFRGTFRSFEQ